ncbi:MAG TPA: hypothetical protein VF817_02275 [Patescibacteria group bacterium]
MAKREDWSKYINDELLDQFKARDIDLMDARARTWLGDASLARPYLTFVLVGETRTLALLWQSKDSKIKAYFPITEPAIELFEYVNPDELNVIFIGTLQQLSESEMAKDFHSLPKGAREDTLALLAFNHPMYLRDESLHLKAFPCTVIMRVIGGELFIPETYIDSTWKPWEWESNKTGRFITRIHALPIQSDDPCYQD